MDLSKQNTEMQGTVRRSGFADKRNITLLSSDFLKSEKIGREYLDGVDIDRLLANPPEKDEIEVKYKIAVTVMELRFWLKDCESPI